MKKLCLFVALMLGLASCQTEPEGLDVNVGGEQDVNITVSLPEGTRADSALGAFDHVNFDEYDVRFQCEVHYGGQVKVLPVQISDNGKSATFPVRLIANRDYKFVVWADLVVEDTTADLHYITSGGLANISINDWAPMDETRDAFTCSEVRRFERNTDITLTLKRPFAKLRVITTDMEELMGVVPAKAEVEYTTPYRATFNAVEGKAGDAQSNKTHNRFDIASYDESGANKTLFADYLFVGENDIVNFNMYVYDQDNELIDDVKSFNTSIPVKRNYVTTIKGNILTYADDFTVTIEDGFDNAGNLEDIPYHYVAVTNGADLLKALMAGNEVIALNDIVATVADKNFEEGTTRSTTAINPVLNLNGYTVTFVNNETEPILTIEEGSSLTIVDEKGTGAIVVQGTGVAIENNGTINIEGGELNEGAIVNNGEANISGGKINEDAITNTANGTTSITGGEFTYTPDADEVGDDYEVKTDENGKITIERKDDVVKIGEEGYTSIQKAVAVAQNGDTILFIADVEQEDGVIITDKNITIDLNDKTFTVSNGASTNNRNFKVNGSSVVTIKNGTMVAAGDYSSGAYGTVRTEGTANVTLEDVILYNYRGNGLNVKACTGTTVTITDTEVYSQYGGGIESAGGTIELTNVKVEQKGMYTAPYNSMAISVNGGGTVTVNSGTYSTECITAEEANNQGTSHGPWCAGVLNSGGTLIIKGGTFSNDNFGENALATYARGLLLADTGANIQIQGGTFNAVKAIIDMTNNLGDASRNPSATISGGDFSADPQVSGLYASHLIKVAEGFVVDEENGRYSVVLDVKVAKVGNTEYRKIDDAIAAWTNNTTLTLMSDVTLKDVITLKSTEHHILNLGTYTLTAASGKNAIEITCNGLSNATYALTINADATNPGGITATGKSCIYYKKSDSTKDRPIILINNGVFTGSYSINSTSNGNTNCPQIWINGGVFNSYMNLTKNMLKVSGGTFHGAINCTGDSSAYRQISGGRFKSWQFMTADADTKFWVGTAKATYDVGVYVDDEGYLVVGGPVITEFGDKFAAKATNYSKWSSYLKYSSAAEYGLYYTNAEMAIAKHGEANVVLK